MLKPGQGSWSSLGASKQLKKNNTVQRKICIGYFKFTNWENILKRNIHHFISKIGFSNSALFCWFEENSNWSPSILLWNIRKCPFYCPRDINLREPIIYFFDICRPRMKNSFQTKSVIQVEKKKFHCWQGLKRVEEISVEEIECFQAGHQASICFEINIFERMVKIWNNSSCPIKVFKFPVHVGVGSRTLIVKWPNIRPVLWFICELKMLKKGFIWQVRLFLKMYIIPEWGVHVVPKNWGAV